MRKLRNDKKISCNGSKNKELLVRIGYFNMINGYKSPFTNGKTSTGQKIYLPNTDISHIYKLKSFDDRLRLLLLQYITKIEEEVRTLTGYKFDQCNKNGKVLWYDTSAYSTNVSLQEKMAAIAPAYNELSRSQLDYVDFYMKKNDPIPTWIMVKVINFSTFISILKNSHTSVTHSLCKLYDIVDSNGAPNVKLLIGSLHWLRKVRNACAHNERIYCLKQSGKISERFLRQINRAYRKRSDKEIMDLLIYFKYYLPSNEFKKVIKEIQSMLLDLQKSVHQNAFGRIRSQMGILNLNDLEQLKNLPKKKIEYHKFDTF